MVVEGAVGVEVGVAGAVRGVQAQALARQLRDNVGSNVHNIVVQLPHNILAAGPVAELQTIVCEEEALAWLKAPAFTFKTQLRHYTMLNGRLNTVSNIAL